MFNKIKADQDGTVAKILFTDGQTTEFGQVLIEIEKA